MVAFPNAKINFGLNVINKRADGYHNLETCFYPIGWSDILEVIPGENLDFSSSGIIIPGNPKENLCIKAYQLLKQDFEIPPVKIHLHKIVPIGAGLGGGSSDAAYTLKLLNNLFKLNLDQVRLSNYAATLGADCAFFIQNTPLFAIEKGDVFQETSISLKGYYLVVIYPGIHVSTSLAYKGIVPSQTSKQIGKALSKDIGQWKLILENDFENTVFKQFPIIKEIKNQLYKQGALYASMSGSGSAVYGIFDKEINFGPMIKNNYLYWSGLL